MHQFRYAAMFLSATAGIAQAPVIDLAAPMPTFYGSRIAFDAARQRVVSSGPGSPVYEFDGAVWAPRATCRCPMA